jgi:hypothetical protein
MVHRVIAYLSESLLGTAGASPKDRIELPLYDRLMAEIGQQLGPQEQWRFAQRQTSPGPK